MKDTFIINKGKYQVGIDFAPVGSNDFAVKSTWKISGDKRMLIDSEIIGRSCDFDTDKKRESFIENLYESLDELSVREKINVAELQLTKRELCQPLIDKLENAYFQESFLISKLETKNINQ